MAEISVIIPVYNAEKYIAGCLDALCAQTFGDIEVLCVDDGSTDGSGSILAEKVLKAEGLRYLCSADTYHDYFCPTIVKPTVKEVLCQLPEEVCRRLDEVVAFEVVLPALDWSLADPALKRHVLVTHFFTGVLPEEIRRQPVLVGEKRY